MSVYASLDASLVCIRAAWWVPGLLARLEGRSIKLPPKVAAAEAHRCSQITLLIIITAALSIIHSTMYLQDQGHVRLSAAKH